MEPPDLAEVGSLELMRRIARRLPSNGREAITLHQVIAGLSTPDVSMMVDGDVQRTKNIETARSLLAELMPRLVKILPGDREVGALCTRYRDDAAL